MKITTQMNTKVIGTQHQIKLGPNLKGIGINCLEFAENIATISESITRAERIYHHHRIPQVSRYDVFFASVVNLPFFVNKQ